MRRGLILTRHKQLCTVTNLSVSRSAASRIYTSLADYKKTTSNVSISTIFFYDGWIELILVVGARIVYAVHAPRRTTSGRKLGPGLCIVQRRNGQHHCICNGRGCIQYLKESPLVKLSQFYYLLIAKLTFTRSQTAWTNPACIISPTSADEVIEAVKILRSSNTSFAIRSGGHSPLSGWADIDNGVLIALRGLADKAYDETTQTVRVGFGSTWDEVYKLLEGYGRGAVGGRAATVGMGFLLGGVHCPCPLASSFCWQVCLCLLILQEDYHISPTHTALDQITWSPSSLCWPMLR
jgi:hypothetical protein